MQEKGSVLASILERRQTKIELKLKRREEKNSRKTARIDARQQKKNNRKVLTAAGVIAAGVIGVGISLYYQTVIKKRRNLRLLVACS